MGQTAAFFDIDGTLTSNNVWKGIMVFHVRRGRRRLTHALFLALHYPLLLPRGLRLLSESTFRRLWTLHLTWYFRGYEAAQMRELSEWVAREYTAPIRREDVLVKVREHLGRGDVVAFVSGAPTPFVEAIAAMWNVPHAIGSPVGVKDGRYTGRMGAPCIDQQKAVYVRQYFAEKKIEIDYAASYAYADSFSDMGLFQTVGHPVAVYPDKQLRALAEAQGWPILKPKT
jgi:HAD superfamily hydrolase (TIGR01490 family)